MGSLQSVTFYEEYDDDGDFADDNDDGDGDEDDDDSDGDDCCLFAASAVATPLPLLKARRVGGRVGCRAVFTRRIRTG